MRIEKVKYSKRMRKRMFTDHYYKVRNEKGDLIGSAQTKDLALTILSRYKKKLKR